MEIIKTPKVENVRMLDRYSKTPSQGTLYLTATHLIFVDPDAKKETWVLHMHIANLEKLPLTTTGSPLLIRTKTFLSVTFVIPKERDCHDVFISLQQLSQPSNVQDLYCFSYTPPAEEIQRALCDTYPKHLYVPATASTTTLIGSSRFRSKGRLPVLSYLYKNKASISRCSQPLSGFSARCLEDEKMLNHVLKTNPNAAFMYVINAMANRAAGKGYENESFYENIKFHFLGVENIHVMRNSLSKIVETCEQKNPTMNSFLSGLESSGWLRHIKSILDTSQFIAEALVEGISVVVHCSDGWDRTAQVCSLSSLLLDPFYRTVSGYQLLDATWQLMQQFPLSFQFNEIFLFTIHDHIHSCQFGTFIGNCAKDRLDLRLSEKTYSLWGYMANHLNEYLNPLYTPEESPEVLVPNLLPQNIRFWRGMYCRFESGVHPREPQADLLRATSDHSFSLDEHVKYLSKRISSVTSLISRTVEKKRSKPKKEQLCNNVYLDNKLQYEKTTGRELEPADHDHPLKVEAKSNDSETCSVQDMTKIDDLMKEMDSVAIDWKSLRHATECSCSSALDHLSKKC
ncbi:hypothetical protein NQ314_005263 [Rhamnusium bicolor]|uniref:Phosphatidylinositol-3-phosphatase n=1 Tax=Rhamnusium bicolor TaxID=1586634 RepID=A0AAV8ZHE8_9CUCU|nr:hypothetical protein NQ314_005263 [Rhamnusium bicolor]